MAMKYGVYITDAAAPKVVRVEADRFALAAFKWAAPAAGALHTGYGTMRPRKVNGVSAAGKSRSEIVPDITADVWTGVATSFVVEDTEGVETTYTITSRKGEMVFISH